MGAKKGPNDYPRVTIRIPEWLREAVERAAERDRRSMSNWIVLALEAVVAEANKRGPTADIATVLKVPARPTRKKSR